MIPLDVDLHGLRRIEASAGTGKTWTVAALVARAIATGAVGVRELVVVTFTRAATHELRDRVRRRLVETRAAIADGAPDDDPFLAGLARRIGDGDPRDDALRRLDDAIHGLDEAAIFTIHGFCQRVLSDRAFEARTPFDSELVQDPDDLIREVVDDHWRRRLYDADADVVRIVRDACGSPDTLVKRYKPYLRRDDVEVVAPGAPDPEALPGFRAACDRLRARVVEDRDAFATFLRETCRWQQRWIDSRLRKLATWLAAPRPDRVPEDVLAYFTAEAEGDRAPDHPAWTEAADVLARAPAAVRAADRIARGFQADLVVDGRTVYRDAKRRLGIVDYDDLLRDLRDALRGPDGARLATRIRGRYRLAIVDEFQDTDPVQWELFRRIYAGPGAEATSGLIVVGDPKQAIYGFRGADVHAYLGAADAMVETLALDRNWRSHPDLVRAVAATFDVPGLDLPFAIDDIPFAAVAAAKDAEDFDPVPAEAGPILRWRFLRTTDRRGSGKEAAVEVASEAVAVEIDRLQRAGIAGHRIAVLVGSRDQGRQVRDALGVRGLRAVLRSHESVFDGETARELARVLRALAEPTDERRVRAALATVLLGVSGEDLVARVEDGNAWDRTLDDFRSWHRCWIDDGPAAALQRTFAAHRVDERLLRLLDGERRIADLAHLVERLQAAWDGGAPGFARLLRWYDDRLGAGAVDDEDEQLRLESDDDLVRVETIHVSKGLEYDFVFCPFLWVAGTGSDPFVAYHRDGRAVLDLREPDADPDARERAAREALSEKLRLAYVALTRARLRCEVVWTAAGAVHGRSAPAWLLHDDHERRGSIEAFAASAQDLDDDGWRAALGRLAARGSGAVEVVEGVPDPLPEGVTRAETTIGPVRSFDRVVPRGRGQTSFSALVRRLSDPAATLDRRDRDPEPGDADAAIPPPAPGRTRHGFPAGTRAGRAIHDVFESVSFPEAARGACGDAVEDALRRHGFDPEWRDVVAEMVADALHAKLDDDGAVRLADVGDADRRVELEFTFPVAGFTGPGLARVLRDHGLAEGAFDEAFDRLGFDRVDGHVRGFIDLLARVPGADGRRRTWIVDWKSNRLGAGAGAYGHEALTREMAEHAYWLQALLYTVATHRFLRARLPGYDYDRDFGGIAYVFVRGVDRDRPSAGVFRDRPSSALVEALDRAMGGAP